MKLADYVGRKFKPKKNKNMVTIAKGQAKKIKTVERISRGYEKESRQFYFIQWKDGTVGPFKNAKSVKWFFNEYFEMI